VRPLKAPWFFRGRYATYEYRKDVNLYGGGQTLDLFRPKAGDFTNPARLIAYFHPGGFTGGSKANINLDWVAKICQAGYAIFSADYPLCPSTTLVDATAGSPMHPVQTQHVKRAVWYMQQTANAGPLGIDPTKVVVAGWSAGSFLALQVIAMRENTTTLNRGLGYADSRMKAFFGGTDPDPVVQGAYVFAAPVNWPATLAEDKTTAIAAVATRSYMGVAGLTGSTSLINSCNIDGLIAPGMPPIAFMRGTQDQVVGPSNNTLLAAACASAGVTYSQFSQVAGHYNPLDVNNPLDPTSGIVPWCNNLFGSAPT
jgi:acetyl esterase/lipase